MSRVRRLLVGATALAVCGVGAPALAHWTGGGAGTGSATSGTLHAPTGLTADAGSHTVTWTASSTAGAPAPSSYLAERSTVTSPDDGSRTWSTVCATSSTSCTDGGIHSAVGTYRVVYRAIARLGTSWRAVSAESAVLTLTVAPSVTVSTPDLLATSDSGTSSTDDVTNVTTPTFTGTATAGATVQLLADGTVVATGTAAADGSYTLQSSALAHGSHVMTTRVTSGSATATSSGSLTVVVDTVAPTLGAVGVVANGSSSNNKALSGTAATTTSHAGAQTSVSVSVAGAGCLVSPVSASVNQSTGAWSGPSVSLERFTSCTATVTQQDTAGNLASATATVVRG